MAAAVAAFVAVVAVHQIFVAGLGSFVAVAWLFNGLVEVAGLIFEGGRTAFQRVYRANPRRMSVWVLVLGYCSGRAEPRLNWCLGRSVLGFSPPITGSSRRFPCGSLVGLWVFFKKKGLLRDPLP